MAQNEAEKSRESQVATEHLLLALLRQDDGLAAAVLNDLGVSIDKVRTAIESATDPSERLFLAHLSPTSEVRKVIDIALEEAERIDNSYVGTEHLLLGLTAQDKGIAGRVLQDLGVNLDKVRGELDRLQRGGDFRGADQR